MDDLFFIPTLVNAFDAENPAASLRAAISELEQTTRDPEGVHRHELGQFFAEIARHVATRRDDLEHELTSELLAAWLGDSREEHLVAERFLEAIPSSKRELEALRATLDDLAPEPRAGFSLIVERDDTQFATIEFAQLPATRSVHGIAPGQWTLRHESGRVLATLPLNSDDVYFTEALPGRPFPLAASTPDDATEFGSRLQLFGGELVIRVVPGIEDATLEIEARDV